MAIREDGARPLPHGRRLWTQYSNRASRPNPVFNARVSKAHRTELRCLVHHGGTASVPLGVKISNRGQTPQAGSVFANGLERQDNVAESKFAFVFRK